MGEIDVHKTKGSIYAVISALVFGFTPVMASWSYELGSNPLTLTFYRNLMVIPIMLVILIIRKIDLKLTKSQLIQLTLVSILFSATTAYLLYASYEYIGIGLATTLHFLYPVLTVLFGFIFFRDRLEKNRIIALVLAITGVALATEGTDSFAVKGIILAVGSSITYAGYLLAVEKTSIKDMDSMKAMFYMCIICSIVIALFNLRKGEIVYLLPPKAMMYTFIVASANSLIAYTLLIISIRFIGAGNAAIFSTLEPVSGVVCGVILLGEKLSCIKFESCLFIIIAVMIPILYDFRKK